MVDDAIAPFRQAFDNARDPYTARNALGITAIPGGDGIAPANAQYVTAAADPTLTAERVLTNTATVTWDFATAGQAKATATGFGNVSNSGTPATGEIAEWVTATTIKGTAKGSLGFVLRAGDTMTGGLTINSAFPNLTLGGSVVPGLKFDPSSGDTVQGNFFQNGDALQIGNGTTNWSFVDLVSGAHSVKGTSTNDAAAAGYVGQYVISDIASGSKVALTTSVAANITSLVLSPGDWDVALQGFFVGGATTNCTQGIMSISLTSSGLDFAGDHWSILQAPAAGLVRAANNWGLTIPMCRISVASNTTVYFVAQATFTVSTLSAYGAIMARRVR